MSGPGPGYAVGKGILTILNIGNLAPGGVYLIPYGFKVVAVFSADVDMPDLRTQLLSTGAVWSNAELDSGVAWTPDQTAWTPMTVIVRSDGVSIRLANTGANQIDAVHIAYES